MATTRATMVGTAPGRLLWGSRGRCRTSRDGSAARIAASAHKRRRWRGRRAGQGRIDMHRWLIALLLVAAFSPAGAPPAAAPPAPVAAAPPAGAAGQPAPPAAPAPRDTMRLAYGSNTGVQ